MNWLAQALIFTLALFAGQSGRTALADDVADEFGPLLIKPADEFGPATIEPDNDDTALPPWRPSLAEIRLIERRLVMPKGANPLRSYDRVYAGTWIDGERVVRGLFFANEFAGSKGRRGKHGTIQILDTLEEFPIWHDGGCTIVNLAAHMKRRKISIGCNGKA